MLEDPLMVAATAEVVAGDRPRFEIQSDIKMKERAREMLAKRYRSGLLSEDDILCCLFSLRSDGAFLIPSCFLACFIALTFFVKCLRQ